MRMRRATEFSATRAMRDVREIAKRPHPLGSAENDRVRDYLVGRLRELGANPAVQTATVARHSPFGPDTWAVVNNVVAKIPGTNPDRRRADRRALRLGPERTGRR